MKKEPKYDLATERARLSAALLRLRAIRRADPEEARRRREAKKSGQVFLSKHLRADIRRLWRGFAPDPSPSVSQ
ncbi:MAG: hypothetical protein WAN16_07555 [Chthoniobacterales bacterium]